MFSVGTKYRLSLWANLAPSSPAAGLRLSLALKEISDAEVRAHGRACRRRLPAVLAGLCLFRPTLCGCVLQDDWLHPPLVTLLKPSPSADWASDGWREIAFEGVPTKLPQGKGPAERRLKLLHTFGSVADRGCLVAGVAVHVKLLDAGTVWLDDLALVTA